jgi:hypothetical protein
MFGVIRASGGAWRRGAEGRPELAEVVLGQVVAVGGNGEVVTPRDLRWMGLRSVPNTAADVAYEPRADWHGVVKVVVNVDGGSDDNRCPERWLLDSVSAPAAVAVPLPQRG